MIAPHGGGDILCDGLCRELAGLSPRAAPHSIGHQQNGRQAFTAERQVVDVGETGPVDHHLRMHRAHQEMILVLGADLARMG